MHEVSLVKNIFTTLEEAFPGRIAEVRGIWLQVGLLSNVQPILMENAFIAVQLNEPQYCKARLHVEVLPILIECDECKTISEVKQYNFMCSCGKPGRKIIQGEEMTISKVEFETI